MTLYSLIVLLRIYSHPYSLTLSEVTSVVCIGCVTLLQLQHYSSVFSINEYSPGVHVTGIKVMGYVLF